MNLNLYRLSGIGRLIKRAERRALVAWVRFAQRHRTSHWLPVGIFFLLFFDGFVMVIPSTICLIAAVTISPQRWILFGFLFAAAASLNNAMTYVIGRSLPASMIYEKIQDFNLQTFFESAQSALHQYGPWATFVGALFGLPTQMITAILGIADTQTKFSNPDLRGIFFPAIMLALLGHAIKSFLIAGLTRYGWVKLERKISREEHLRPEPNLPKTS